MELLHELVVMAKKNVRNYGMNIAFVVIIAFFTITTKGLFLSPRNISNLINQNAYIAVMSVAMTLILVIQKIDLSVGYFAGFMGAVAAVFLEKAGMPVGVAIPAVLALGALFGLFNGFLVARVGVPAFVATLGGMFLFKGLLVYVINQVAGGSVVINDDVFNMIGNGFLPEIARVMNLHLLSVLIGAACIVAFVYFQFRSRRNLVKYGFEVTSMPVFIVKLALISVLIAYLTYLLASYNGFSWTAVIVAAVAFCYNFVMNKTTFGRHVYAVGGNPEAAELSGINVKRLTMIVFVSMSAMAALAGIMLSSRLKTATAVLGQGKELYAIAGAFVGGTSPAGGIGKVTGSIIGAYIMASLTNGMNLMGIGSDFQDIAVAVVLVLAVVFDILTHKAKTASVN